MISFEADLQGAVPLFTPDADQGSTPAFGADVEAGKELSLEQIKQQAFADGAAAARSELPWSEAEQVSAVLAQLETSAARLKELEIEYLQSNRDQLVDLAIAVAEEIIAQHSDADRSDLLFRIERTISIAPEREPLRIHLGASDLESLRAFQGEEIDRIESTQDVRFEERDALCEGDVMLVSGARQLDARVATQLREIRQALREPIAEDSE